jgi:hypothetical protein
MGIPEPRTRHRGFFLHSADGEAETGDHESAEGLVVRFSAPAQTAGHKNGKRSTRAIAGTRFGGRSHRSDVATDSQPAIRSGSVTGSRQRSHLPR